jgi:hypothetical protein
MTMFSLWGIKTRRQLISLIYNLAIWVFSLLGMKAGAVLGSQGIIKLSAALLGFHLFTFRLLPISLWVQQQLIREALCPSCGQAIELIGQYRCGCGYMSPMERHVFSPCPLCGKCFRWLTCPACETSILI